MRPCLAAAAAALLVSSALSAQPARRVSRHLVQGHDSGWPCTSVEAPLITRTTTGRHGSTFSLDVLAEFRDSVAAQPLPAVLVRASVLQSTERPDPFPEDPTLTLRLDGGHPQRFEGLPGRLMYDRRKPNRVLYGAWFLISRADLERIARARSITGTAAGRTFTLGPEQMETLRDLAAYAARSPRAPVPRSAGEGSLDCLSYEDILYKLGIR